MKIITDLHDLKKGDTVIVVNGSEFEQRGFRRVTGDIFNIDAKKPQFTIKCLETKEIERVNFIGAKVFLIDGH